MSGQNRESKMAALFAVAPHITIKKKKKKKTIGSSYSEKTSCVDLRETGEEYRIMSSVCCVCNMHVSVHVL